jgi:hypothetical protein
MHQPPPNRRGALYNREDFFLFLNFFLSGNIADIVTQLLSNFIRCCLILWIHSLFPNDVNIGHFCMRRDGHNREWKRVS